MSNAAVDYRPLSDSERKGLSKALKMNAEHGRGIKMNARDTSFAGVADEETEAAIQKARAEDEVVVNAIRSVPTHY